MPDFSLDTAAVLKRYRTEPGSAVVDELFDARTATDTLTSSRFTLLEGTSVARRLLQGRVLKRRAYAALMARFLQEMDTAVTLAPVTDALIGEATAAVRLVARPGTRATPRADQEPVRHRLAEAAGKPKPEVSAGARPDPAEIERLQKLGVERAVFAIMDGPRDEMLARLDEAAGTVNRFA